jgi:PAS domain S-box-containing protein
VVKAGDQVTRSTTAFLFENKKTIMKRIYCLVFSALLLLLIFQPLYGVEPGEMKRVLILYSEDKTHPAHQMIEQGIESTFQSNHHFALQLYTEYLDVSRFGDLPHAQVMADFLHRKYSGMKFDAFITVYPYALDFLLAHRLDLFPGVPVIAAMISSSHAADLERSGGRSFVTGTILRNSVTDVMDSALRLKPGMKRIALVAGTAPNDVYIAQGFRSGFTAYAGKLGLIDLTKLSMEETLSRVGSLSPDTLVVYASLLRDRTGKIYVPREALSLISRASKVPVFSFTDSYLGFGIVGGRLVSFKEHGREAAALALRVMGGESPASIPFGGEQAFISTYDWRELKRWGISEKALPPGSTVKFKSLTVWEQYRKTILGGLFFIAFETLLIVGLFVNLHKRRRAEAEIAASALRYRTVADYTHDWEYWSAPNGAINYVSPSCQRITGYSVGEFMEDPSLFFKIILPEDRKVWNQHDHEARNLVKPREIQFRILTKGGEIRWIDHNCLPVNDPQGNFLGVRASNRDITDRKKTEFEVQQQRNELAHVTRVATMGELTSSLAHEINQPLAAIRNYASAAQRFLSQSEPNLAKAREALEGIIRDDKRAAEVISGVRGLLKKEEPRYRSVQMNEIIQESLSFIRSDSVLEGLSIETELARDLSTVPGDRVQLQQVLLNLMLNAVDAMNKTNPELRKLVIRTEKDGDGAIKVSVRDSGAGIDDIQRNKLFELFQTTKPGGMGLGLAICARIIHAHGGSIRGENNPDGGATFSFTLPTGGDE